MSAPKLGAREIIVATIQNLIEIDPALSGYDVQYVEDKEARTMLDAVLNKGYKLTYTVNDRDGTVRAQITSKL